VTKKLSLNYGLRYEYFGPLHNGDKDTAVFTPRKRLARFKVQASIRSSRPTRTTLLAPGICLSGKE